MMKSRIRQTRIFSKIMLLICMVGLILPLIVTQCSASPSISRYSVTPRYGSPDDEFLFLVTYTNTENKAPESIYLVIDNKNYDLIPVSDEDLNYTDGKDYTVKKKISEGTHIFYFEASDGNETASSRANTIVVKTKDQFTHLDVAYSLLVATFIVLIPLIYGIYQLKKIANN